MNKQTVQEKNQTDREILQEFREKFLMKGSECTWKNYPEPEELEQFLLAKLHQRTEEIIECFEKAYKEGILEYHQNVTGVREDEHYANGAWKGFKALYLDKYLIEREEK